MINPHYEKTKKLKEEAINLLNQGFTTKSSKKKSLELMVVAYGIIIEKIINPLLLEKMRTTDCINEEDFLRNIYYSLPNYPHQWNEKHNELIKDFFPKEVEEIKSICDLMVAIKSQEIQTTEKTEEIIKKQKLTFLIEKTIKEELDRKKTNMIRQYNLAKILGLNVTVSAHRVINHKGTCFDRCFYYLNGELTSLNKIIYFAMKLKKG